MLIDPGFIAYILICVLMIVAVIGLIAFAIVWLLLVLIASLHLINIIKAQAVRLFKK